MDNRPFPTPEDRQARRMRDKRRREAFHERNRREREGVTPEEADVPFASQTAADKAEEYGLTASDFSAQEYSGKTGFTSADVERIADARPATKMGPGYENK